MKLIGRLLNVAIVLSLPLALGAGALWVRGRWVSDRVWWNGVSGTGAEARFWDWLLVANDGIFYASRRGQVVRYATPADAAFEREGRRPPSGGGLLRQASAADRGSAYAVSQAHHFHQPH